MKNRERMRGEDRVVEAEPLARRASRRRRIVRVGIVLCVILLLAGGSLLAVTVEPMRAWVFGHVGQDCGMVAQELGGPLADPAAARRAESCFVTAFAGCQPAALRYVVSFLDGKTSNTFVVEPAVGSLRTCSLADAHGTLLAGGGRLGVGTETCTGVVRDGEGLRFLACDQLGDVHVPG